MLKTECATCGSKLEYESGHESPINNANDEQVALTKWLEAHNVCRERARKTEEK